MFLRNTTPRKADGTEPSASQPARFQRTVPRPAWTAAPTGFMISDATRSLDTAASGAMPKTSTRIGVISAPPPIPVSPTAKPTISPANATKRSMCTPRRLLLVPLPRLTLLHYFAGRRLPASSSTCKLDSIVTLFARPRRFEVRYRGSGGPAPTKLARSANALLTAGGRLLPFHPGSQRSPSP